MKNSTIMNTQKHSSRRGLRRGRDVLYICRQKSQFADYRYKFSRNMCPRRPRGSEIFLDERCRKYGGPYMQYTTIFSQCTKTFLSTQQYFLSAQQYFSVHNNIFSVHSRARNSGLPMAKSRPYFRNGRQKQI